jgi:hypothetical protein
MNFAFDFWQRWGAALDDVSFANALLALGLVSSDREKRTIKDLQYFAAPSRQALWYFPQPATPVEGTLEEWAQAWAGVHSRLQAPVRLYVKEAPPDEPVLPWSRILYEASPAPDAVALFQPAPRAQFHMEWPLRLGGLSGSAWAFLEEMKAKNLWPARKVARMVQVGREQANCDVLLHRGPVRALLRELLALPFNIKANVVVMRGGAEVDWAELQALLTSVMAETRASGFVLLPAQGEDDGWLRQFLNKFLAEMSHARPVDVAFALACPKDSGRDDLIAGFTPEITDFTLRQLVERYNKRMAALPPGTEVDLSRVGPADQWLTQGVEGGGSPGGQRREAMPPDVDRHVPATSVRMREDMMFDSELHGGSTIAEVADAVADAAPPAEAEEQRTARFLQQRSFVLLDKQFVPAKEGFIAGKPAKIEVRIGLPEEGLDQAPTVFPVEELPPELERWTLVALLSEPDHLRTPLRRQIRLPRDGNSDWCEFLFRPRELPRFEGRLTVLHRGRVIQTALLRASVLSAKYPAVKDGAPKLEDEIAVRHRLGDLDRRQFDLAFVANHDSKGRPLLTAVSAKAAWVKDLTPMRAIGAQINEKLLPVAKSVQDYTKGLDGKKGEALLVQLAKLGGWLRVFLDEALEDAANNPATAREEYIQIVSTSSDSVVPLEFVYDFEVPETGAKVCKHWKDGVVHGKCLQHCERKRGKWVCPMGFWGLSKVIERHALTPSLAKDGNVLYLQSEVSRNSETLHLGGTAVLGSSSRVPKAKVGELREVLASHCGAPPETAPNWDKWEELVTNLHPALLVALPHTDGIEPNITVEIGNDTKDTISLRQTHVFPPPQKGRDAPLVLLIGCDLAGAANEYGSHVRIFRNRGAGIIVGTIATVYVEHAPDVTGKLVEGLLPAKQDKPVRLGELIRAVRRNSLLNNLLMPLSLVAYGDADWILSRGKPNG